MLAAELQPKPDRRLAAYEATFEAAALQCSAARPRDPRSCTSRRPAWRPRSSSGSTRCGRRRASPCGAYAVTRRCACAARSGDRRAGRATGIAAAAYAEAVLIICRMGGITGEVSEGDVRAMLARGRELVADDDDVTRTVLLLDEAWIAWRFNRLDGLSRPSTPDWLWHGRPATWR